MGKLGKIIKTLPDVWASLVVLALAFSAGGGAFTLVVGIVYDGRMDSVEAEQHAMGETVKALELDMATMRPEVEFIACVVKALYEETEADAFTCKSDGGDG